MNPQARLMADVDTFVAAWEQEHGESFVLQDPVILARVARLLCCQDEQAD